MGDVAMSIPVIRALTEKHPECKITVLSKPFFKPLFDKIPQVSFFAAQVNTKHNKKSEGSHLRFFYCPEV